MDTKIPSLHSLNCDHTTKTRNSHKQILTFCIESRLLILPIKFISLYLNDKQYIDFYQELNVVNLSIFSGVGWLKSIV